MEPKARPSRRERIQPYECPNQCDEQSAAFDVGPTAVEDKGEQPVKTDFAVARLQPAQNTEVTVELARPMEGASAREKTDDHSALRDHDKGTTSLADKSISTILRICATEALRKPPSENVLGKTKLGVELMDAQDIAAARRSASSDDRRAEVDGVKSASMGTPYGIRSSPPTLVYNDAMDIDPEPSKGVLSVADAGAKSDSEAETIVLPGKDGHSPSKIRKAIKYEDHSDDDEIRSASGAQSPRASRGEESVARSHLGEKSSELTSTTPNAIATSTLGKRKRPKHGNANVKDNSSGLSSVPTSPVATARSSLSKPTASDSDISKSPSPPSHSTTRDQAKSVDRIPPKRKQYTSGDEEEADRPRFSRQRSSGVDQKPNRDNRSSSKFNADTHPRKRTRSDSPHARSHRRSVSTQLPSKSSHGLSYKKKRVPAPLQSTEYHSDDSSASGSSHPRSSRLRNLAAPTTGDSAMSPAKMGPHKKHVNSSGQTLLARACLQGKLEMTKQRFEERPQDLNEADHALNTPLHVASINGFADIVKFLLDKNCVVDCVNDQRDTPLHDAIENGHVEVVKLLLDAGANPNKPNREGDGPLDLVAEKEESGAYDESEATEIRAAIMAAKHNSRDIRRPSEDDQMHDNIESRSSHHKENSRHSPVHETHVISSTSRRVGTARSIKTSDHLLYQPLDATELRKAAKEGDASAAARVLEVNTNLKDTKSLLLAARGGHFDVINILFAMGGFDPDPEAVDGVSPEQATPILAAIGRDDNLKVIELFLGQDNFDPTRLIKGETYYEIARKRAGPKWQEEEQLLKDAFDKYEKSHKASSGNIRSPGRRRDGREVDREGRRLARREEQRSHKRSTSSPKAKDVENSKGPYKKQSSATQSKDGQVQPKRGPGRPRKEENIVPTVVSDPEMAPLGPPKQKPQTKRSESDVAVVSESETTAKPRRKLVSGKELRGERELEKQRRTSVASTASSASVKDKRVSNETKGDKLDGRISPSVPRGPKKPGAHQNEHDFSSEKHTSDKDRARSLKRDDSKDRLTAIRGESPVKRHRTSATPPRSGMQEVTSGYGTGGGPLKRRKLETDSTGAPKAESTPNSSPDLHTSTTKTPAAHEAVAGKSAPEAKAKSSQSAKMQNSPVEEAKNPNVNEPHAQNRPSKPGNYTQESNAGKHKPMNESAAAAQASEQARVAEEKRKEEEAIREAEARKAEELEAARRKLLEEQEELERIEKAKQARLAREEEARQEEAKRLQEEAERKERQRIKDAEAHARAMEEQRILYLEQERLKREEQERRRTIALEQQRAERARVEEERRLERLSKLPPLLRWFDACQDPKSSDVASLFRWIDGYRYDTIRPEAAAPGNPREQWMLNTQVAILLGEKDLRLSRYTAWERVPLSDPTKRALWKVQNGIFTLREPNLAGLRKQVPKPEESVYQMMDRNKNLFLELDVFFVKVSEFMFIVPNFPHLRGIEMHVHYRELDTSFQSPPPTPKWKLELHPNSSHQFAPQPKVYVNGQLLRQLDTPLTKVSREPPPDDRRVPRRELVPVYPHETDYEELCKKQGLIHLLPGYQGSPSSSSPFTVHPNGQAHVLDQVNGMTPPSSDRTKSVNGGSPHRSSMSEIDRPRNLPNGLRDVTGSPHSN
ncbi:hypothetical protein G7Y89_g5733 [Cudoniella acicularis]|uniref:Ankyrin repeat protein n=1 Tax=Cudoniella acicularis TaxID=354080 RepID=A0A8H4RNB3_9HELO|nr:hypothetical protein G7Y89_g5733 [Cudoniella acicularis]